MYLTGIMNINYLVNLFKLFRILIKILLSEIICPVQQRLPDHRANVVVVPPAPGLDDLGDEVVLPPSLLSRTLGPSPDLSLVILGPSSLVEPTVPLEPTIRILFVHPARVLPFFQTSSTLDLKQ